MSTPYGKAPGFWRVILGAWTGMFFASSVFLDNSVLLHITAIMFFTGSFWDYCKWYYTK